jgi:hypothetical protein
MLDISAKRQKQIVVEIQNEFSTQDKIKRQIEAKRKEIELIIEQSLKGMTNQRGGIG